MDDSLKSVTVALQMAREEVARLVELLREQGAQAFRMGDERTFDRLRGRCQAVEDFQKRFAALSADWQAIASRRRASRKSQRRARQVRASRGELLPERAYVFPILQVLKKAGGSARVREVLAGLGPLLGSRLTPRDREALGRGQIRWDNRAQWVRRNMVQAGLLAANSPRGTWQITAQGSQELERGDLERTWERLTRAKRRGA